MACFVTSRRGSKGKIWTAVCGAQNSETKNLLRRAKMDGMVNKRKSNFELRVIVSRTTFFFLNAVLLGVLFRWGKPANRSGNETRARQMNWLDDGVNLCRLPGVCTKRYGLRPFTSPNLPPKKRPQNCKKTKKAQHLGVKLSPRHACL